MNIPVAEMQYMCDQPKIPIDRNSIWFPVKFYWPAPISCSGRSEIEFLQTFRMLFTMQHRHDLRYRLFTFEHGSLFQIKNYMTVSVFEGFNFFQVAFSFKGASIN
jgi:hypothetical protein